MITAKGFPYRFYFLNFENQEEIVDLRQSAYQKGYGSRLNPKKLDWNQIDQESLHLGIRHENNGKLLAYLRLTFFTCPIRLEASTLFPTPPDLKPPYSLLARASCDPGFSGKGLHSVLRCRALEICLQLGFHSVFGTLEIAAERWPSLKKLGYLDLARKKSWGEKSLIQAEDEVCLIALLGKNDLFFAIQALLNKWNLRPMNFTSREALYFLPSLQEVPTDSANPHNLFLR